MLVVVFVWVKMNEGMEENKSCVKYVLSVLNVLNGCVMDVNVNVGE